MPPRERFYAATTGSRAPPGNARAPHKANESRRVHEGRRSPANRCRYNYRDTHAQRSSRTLISILCVYSVFVLQNARAIFIRLRIEFPREKHTSYNGERISNADY